MKPGRAIALGICLTGGLLAAQTGKPPATPPEPAAAGTTKPEAKPAEPAPAAATAAPAGVRADSPCRHDIELLCANVQPGAGRIYRCLAEKESELSNNCKARLADLRATGGECKEDIAKFCADVPHARGKLAQCLTEHHDQLSEACKALSAQAKGATAATAATAAATPATAATPPAAPPKAQEAGSSPALDAGAR